MLGLFSGTCGCGKGTLRDPYVKRDVKNIRVIFWYRCFVVCERVGWVVELLSNIGYVPLFQKVCCPVYSCASGIRFAMLWIGQRWKRLD